MDTLNEQEPTLSQPSGNSPDGAGDQTQKSRVDQLMGLANRRLTQAQKAEAERDAALAEIEALRASLDAGWEAEKAGYWQQPEPESTGPYGPVEAEPGDAEAESTDAFASDDEGEDYDPDTDFSSVTNPPVRIEPNAAPRTPPRSLAGTEPSLDAVRAAFNAASEAESERLRHLRDWP